VTDYLIEAMLAKNGMSTTDINLANLDDSAHISTFENDDSVRNLGTWNPMTLQLQNFRSPSVPAVHTLFTSHEIPGEIQDWLIVRTNVLKAHPEVGDALAADWYHTTPLVERRDARAIGIMAATAGSSVQDYTHMLTTTHLYYTATEADQFTTSADMKKFTQKVRDFCYHRGLMGMGHNDANEYGISFSDGTILGNPHDVRLHFDDTWMRKAAHNLLH
jgi:NitT/TauT family transport system substrate-binding protein